MTSSTVSMSSSDEGGLFDVAFDLGPEGTADGRERDVHHRATAVHGDVAHHAEFDDGGPEFGVEHLTEALSQSIGGVHVETLPVNRSGVFNGVFPHYHGTKNSRRSSMSNSTITSVNLTKKDPNPINLTDGAAAKVAELIAAEGVDEVLALRVSVKPGGCSGFNYDMYFDSEFADDDIVREFAGVKVVVDSSSAELLNGSTLEYSDSLQGAGFHITNPNATRTCGCGNSFS